MNQKKDHLTIYNSKIKVRALIKKINVRVNAMERNNHVITPMECLHREDIKGLRNNRRNVRKACLKQVKSMNRSKHGIAQAISEAQRKQYFKNEEGEYTPS
jgi:hypothetical protein